MRQIIPMLLLALFLSACVFVSAEENGIQLKMDSTSYSPNSIGMLQIRNFTDQPVYLKPCTNLFPLYTIQKRQDNGSYRDVFTNTCVSRPPAARKVNVESLLQIQMRVVFDVGRGESATGTYRIRLSLHRDADATTPALSESVSVTKPFFVR